jgi:hypothetical protein
MRFEIYKNYGVLGTEKKCVYTFKAPHPLGDYSEKINVQLLENEYFTLVEDKNGCLYVESAWGWSYDVDEVLQGNAKPCFYALDTGMAGHRVYLNIIEEDNVESC